MHGDETEWEVNCRLWLRRQSHVLQRCLTGSPRISVAISAHPFLGGLEPTKEDAYWPRDVDHRRTGPVIFPIIYLKTFLPNYLCCVYVFLRGEQLFKDLSHHDELKSICLTWSEDLFTNSTTSMDPETNRCFGLLIIPRLCRSHGTQTCRFFKTVAPLLMKTVSGFIRMKNFKLTLISKEISTLSSLIPNIIT